MRLLRACILGLTVTLFFALAATSAFARTAFVANNEGGKISTFDTATDAAASPEIVSGVNTEFAAITPDGRTAYVSNFGSNDVSVIDVATKKLITKIPLGKESGVGYLAISPDGKTVYVASSSTDTVAVIDTATDALEAPIPVGDRPFAIAVAPDGRTLYVTEVGKDEVGVVDTATKKVKTQIAVGGGVDSIALTPDGKSAYVTRFGSESVSVIDTATDTVSVPSIKVGEKPEGVAISPDGRTAYVANRGSEGVSVIDTATNTVRGPEIITGELSSWPAFAPDGKTAYVTVDRTNDVAVVDTATGTVRARIPVGRNPEGIAITPDQSPSAVLAAPVNPIVAGTPVSFDGSASSDPDSPIANYAFSFGDGQSQNGAAATASHVFKIPGTYTVTLATTDTEGCTQSLVFTGQTAYCNGSSSTQATQKVTVVAAPPVMGTIHPPIATVRLPRVKVACPPSAKPKGCTFELQIVAKKPTRKHRKVTAESAVAKAKLKAGKSASVTLHPKPAFAKRLAAAKKVLVEETVTAKGKTKTRFVLLRVLR